MKRMKGWKTAALAAMLAASLALSACYVAPDDTTTGSDNAVVGSSSLPFRTIQPTSSPSPTPAPATPAPTQSGATVTGDVNWDAWNATSAPAQTAANPGSNGLIGVTITAPPTYLPVGTQPAQTGAPVATIPVVTPAPATPKPTATPAPTALRKGSSGASVRSLQERLRTLGYYSGSIDGDYGEGTEAAVKAFQKANGLTADGKAGTRTLEALYSRSVKRATAAPAVTATPRVTAVPRATATPRTDVYLSLGSSNTSVKRLQERLISLGYLSGKADGKYGGATQAAVSAYQKRVGLWVDGKAGPDTLNSLYSSGAPYATEVAATVGVTLEKGMEGESVRALQRRLRTLGYYSGSIDGSYGDGTAAAVAAFQQANGLTADGKAGTATLNAIYADSASAAGTSGSAGAGYLYTGSASAGGAVSYTSTSGADFSGVTGTVVSTSGQRVTGTNYTTNATVTQTDAVAPKTLEQGSYGASVKTLQQALKRLGFYTGKVDGQYGPGTVTAVISFQMSRGLTPDGKAGQKTLSALYSAETEAARYPTLKKGDRGQNVTNLQFTLYDLNYYTGEVDGRYGDSTAAAVSAFQTRNGLTATGTADPSTLAKLYSSSAKAAPAASGKYKTLRPGDAGEDVLEMKDVLIQLGYPATRSSNVYDAQTEQAVRLFQQKNGLTVDGVAGGATLRRLYSDDPVGNH